MSPTRGLSGKGNPTWATMDAILTALGFQFAFEIRPPKAALV